DSPGFTLTEPFRSSDPSDSIVTSVAFFDSQVSFADSPLLISCGETLSVTVGCGGGGGGSTLATGFLAQPAMRSIAAASVRTNTNIGARDFINFSFWIKRTHSVAFLARNNCLKEQQFRDAGSAAQATT